MTSPLSPYVKWLVRCLYLVGISASGYAMVDLLMTQARFAAVPSAAMAVFLEGFALAAATYSTRARLRGDSSLITRSVVAFGTVGTSALQLSFHWHDNRLLATALPLLSVLALVAWMLDVADSHAATFTRQKTDRLHLRRKRISVAVEAASYLLASGVGPAYAEWKARVRLVGHTRRQALATAQVAAYAVPTPRTVAAMRRSTRVVPPTQRPHSDSGGTRVKPTVIGTDILAVELRALEGSASDCARLLWQQHGPDASPTAIQRTLATYGVEISRPVVSDLGAAMYPQRRRAGATMDT